jgi:putative membrane protein
MNKTFASRFLVRWLVTSLGLYVAAALLGESHLDIEGHWGTLLIAGFFLALVNMALKPLLIVLSFPAIILSLGLFMLVVNGFLILVASWIYHPLYVRGLGTAIVAGIIIGLVNYLVTRILEEV